jgi:hypothetical protein
MKIYVQLRLITISKCLRIKRQLLASHRGGIVSSVANPYGICGGQGGIETGLFSEHFSFSL